jgi:hypothetical protein
VDDGKATPISQRTIEEKLLFSYLGKYGTFLTVNTITRPFVFFKDITVRNGL